MEREGTTCLEGATALNPCPREWEGGGVGGGCEGIKNSDTWDPRLVGSIEERYRGCMDAEELNIEERISMIRTRIFFRGKK